MALPKVTSQYPMLGSDPEFFFKLDGQIIGAEKVLPKAGLIAGNNSKFIIDGVQAELNPRPNTCRDGVAREIQSCFMSLKNELVRQGKNISVDFSRTVEISKDNLLALDEQARKFGCAPSQSSYLGAGIKIEGVDPEKYLTRAAGGHIHIGHSEQRGLKRALVDNAKNTVKMLDLIVGNTCVLLDRDESNIERRKLYGRAGEYRLPKHGLEYRTLSNFWLTSIPLMSFVFGLTRYAVNLMADDAHHKLFFDEFMSKVDLAKVIKAINNNDFDLAMENFSAIEKLILESTPKGLTTTFPINSESIKGFHHFVDKIKSNGLTYWFKDDPMKHWTTESSHNGFYAFHEYKLKKDMGSISNKINKAINSVELPF